MINDAQSFGHKLRLCRELRCPTSQNTLTITDTVENYGDKASPLMLLYHMNMGYPLLSENAVVEIPSVRIVPRNEHSAEGLDSWNKMRPPVPGFEEQCYFHEFEGEGSASIRNPDCGIGLAISYDPKELDYFTEWKMMGVRDYVLGLEPGNCHPDGRAKMRAEGRLKFLEPGEKKTYRVKVSFAVV